ncbi:hypothetical protein UVI_02003990 [Ustilaginoidea virens]|uniref:Uncharacterized protein n=1 Tax=Ustilaginoidea virens TaxID=1159556 RepID=A0A1B5KSL1_USTVR|nr:hypothetical protein UVI_02003990 [Ustilaginoidea virens]
MRLMGKLVTTHSLPQLCGLTTGYALTLLGIRVLKTSRFAFGKSDSTHKTAQTSTFSSRTLLGPVKDFDASQSHVGIWALEEQVFSYALFEAMGGADDVNLGKDGSNGTRSSRWEQK